MIGAYRPASLLIAVLISCSVVAGCRADENGDSYPWPESSGPLAATGQGWGRPGGEDVCWVETGTMKGHFGAHVIINSLDETVIWTGVRVDGHVQGEVTLLGQYGQWVRPDLEGDTRGYWDEWPPHASPEDGVEPEVIPLDFPVTIEPGEALNPLVGFEADATAGVVHLPYLIYDYEVDRETYQLIDPMGVRLEPNDEGCESPPEIFDYQE